jgi:hypothetical protein
MKYLGIIGLCLILSVNICAHAQTVTAGFELVDEEIYEVVLGEKITINVPLIYIGTSPVTVNKIVNKTCGCVAGQRLSASSLQPGEITILEVLYDPSNIKSVNNFMEYLFVTEGGQVLTLNKKVQVNVDRSLMISPLNHYLGRIKHGTIITKNVKINGKIQIHQDDIKITSTSNNIQYKLIKAKENKRGNQYTIEINVINSPEDATGKDINASLQLQIQKFKGKDRTFEIGISANMLPDAGVVPENQFIGYMKPGKTINKSFVVYYKNDLEKLEVVFPKGFAGSYKTSRLTDSEIRVDYTIESTGGSIKKNEEDILINFISNGIIRNLKLHFYYAS